MKKITLIVAFLVAAFSYGQTTSGFVANPSFEDGSVGNIAGNATLNDWKTGGGRRNTAGVSASIQTTNVHAGDGSNALEVTSNSSNGTGNPWDIRLINTTYPFAGNNTDPIVVTVSFWAKTTDVDPASLNASGDMRLLVKDIGTSSLGDQTNIVLLTTNTWERITKTFTFLAAADYSLSLYFEFGKLDGVTQIDDIKTSVSGGASIGDITAPVINLVGDNTQQLTRGDAYVELGATATDDTDDDTALTATIAIDATAVDTATAGTYSVTYDVSDATGNAATQVTRTVTVYSGIVVNPSFEDGSTGVIAGGTELNDWRLEGARRLDAGVSASIQTTNVHAGDGSNALEVTSNSSSGTGNDWDITLRNTAYPSFAGDGTNPIEVRVEFWAKTTDNDPGSLDADGDMKIKVKDWVSGVSKFNRVLLTTGSWVYITKTFTFDAAANYSLSLYFEIGKVDGVTQIDGIKTSVTGGATLASDSITWDGSTDKDWNTTTNWTPERVPTETEKATIPAGLTNYPTISSGAITLAAIDIKSGAAFVANGTTTVTGAATYSRNFTHTAGNTNGWYLVGSPLVGETLDDTWVNANSLATGSGANRGLATYTESDNTWDYFLTGESGTFTPGTGYSVKRSATGDVSFTGTINTADTDVTLVRTDNGFNLVANPYTSYINSETLLDNNTVVSNNKNIYVWNNGTTSYDTKISTAAFQVAPGQAFFVRSNEGGGTLTFAKSNQSDNSGTDTFQRTAVTIPEIELSVADESTHRYIKLYFNDAATKGFDNGYDGDLFGGVANSFEIYSHLLEDNQGEKYQIQSLPNSDLASMVIPVGLKAASGKELAFSVKKLNLPTDIKVYLEDRVTNRFTLLDETNSVYNITLSSALDGIGRFYLHTSNSVLSTSDVNLNSVSIFKINNSNLRVAGLSKGKASISLYNILGKQMMMTTFDAINTNDISLPKLAAGVYIVQLTTEAGKLNKKIILK
jgi:hypothetical protein